MFEKANLLALVRKHQNKNDNVETYFSLGTALNMAMGKEKLEAPFIVSFGDASPTLPKEIIHKHFFCPLNEVNYYQPLVLDSILISTKDGSVIDFFGAKKNIADKIIRTTEDPHKTLINNPELIIRIASLKSETGFDVDKDTMGAIESAIPLLKCIPGNRLWKEFKRLLKSDAPSQGVEFLRLSGALKIILPELDECYGVEQNVQYHKYTVYEHSILACDACIKYDPRLRFAALIHDVGKPETKGKNDRGITFHKHEVASTRLTREIVKRFEIKKSDAYFIVSMVSNHMYQYDRKWKTTTVIRFIQKVGLHKGYVGRLSSFPLFQIRHADRMGRGLNPITKKQLDFEKRIEQVLLEKF